MLACVITVSHLPNPLGASVHMHIDQVLVRDRCNRTVRAPNPALTGACSNQPNPGDPIPSSSPAHAHVSRRWLPDCFRLEGGSLVGGPYDRPIIRHARQEPSGEACRIVGHVLDGRSSPRTEHLILDRPGRVRPRESVGVGLSPGMPRLSRCRRRLVSKQAVPVGGLLVTPAGADRSGRTPWRPEVMTGEKPKRGVPVPSP